MGVVEESVEDGVAEGLVADGFVPVFDGDLGGEDGALAGVAVVEEFQEVEAALVGDGGQAPVVEDEQTDFRESLDEAGVGAVGAGEGEFVHEAGDAVVAG